jgi:single-stranded-DNA-specific exonuclease
MMPSGPEHLLDQPAGPVEFHRARDLLLANRARWRVIYHYDGDGIASASSALRAFHRLGYPVQATPLLAVERPRMLELLKATPGPVLVVDTGASWLDAYAAHPHPVVVLDHHKYPGAPHPPSLPPHVAFVNPLDWGVDGMDELCAATLTWLFTIFLDEANWDNAPWGLSGAIADRQHQNGFHGLNARLIAEAEARGLVKRRPRLALFGTTVGEAVARSIDPFVKGLSGRPAATRTFLEGLGIEAALPRGELKEPDERRLGQALLARLVHQKVRPEFAELLTQDGYILPGLSFDAQELSNWQNACGRAGEPSVGIALALGDRAALATARTHEESWRSGILSTLLRLEEKGVNSLSAIQWFESEESSLAGTQAGLAMNYLLDPNRPVFVVSSGEGVLKISGRGTLYLVGRGLDLSQVLRTAAAKVGGEGGGHRVASGATIPDGRREEFLDEANRLVAAQLPREAAA